MYDVIMLKPLYKLYPEISKAVKQCTIEHVSSERLLDRRAGCEGNGTHELGKEDFVYWEGSYAGV